MTDLRSARRKFLIACEESRQPLMTSWIEGHFDLVACFYADDGFQALQKVSNDPPHVMLVDDQLPKKPGREVALDVLSNQKSVSVILVGEIPDTDELADYVALGQLQFLNPNPDAATVGGCIARALNWLSVGENLEFSVRFLGAGEYLMRKGDKAESVYILRRGSMKAFAQDDVVHHDVVLGEISPKEFVGEMAYINGDVRSADVVATSDCELIEIPIPHLDRLLFQKPAWAMALMRTLSKRMKAANERLSTAD